MDPQVMQDVVEQAARAPSIHNTQPWRFVARGDVLEVWTDPDRGLAVLDPTGRARHLSCGAAVLHARVAAAAAGLSATVSVAPDPGHADHLADLRLSDDGAAPTGDADLGRVVASRRTSREPFSPGPVGSDVLAALREAAGAEGCWLRLVDSPDDAAAVAVLLARADEEERSDPAYVDELRRWTGRDETSADGVPTSAVPDTAPAERGSNYRLRDFVADRDDAEAAAASSHDPPPVERPTVAVLGTTDDDVAAWLAAGQGLARVLLTATAAGVSASPMTQPLEVPEIRSRLAAELSLVGHPQMLLRLGYAGPATGAVTTPRRPVEEILSRSEE